LAKWRLSPLTVRGCQSHHAGEFSETPLRQAAGTLVAMFGQRSTIIINKKNDNMKVTKKIIYLLILVFIFVSCGKDKEKCKCAQKVIVSETEYKNTSSDPFSIDEMKIVGDCLKIKFSASGCSGNTWKVKLIDSGYYWDTDPLERVLKLVLENTEECKALITKEVSFNIKELQLCTPKIMLFVSGTRILYEY
jgi:hypothetical protein